MSRCDLLICGARVVDGSGGPSRFVDVAVDRGRIAALGDCADWQADIHIDASGLALAPGFIDSHTHDDLAVLQTPLLECKLSQGVTTVIAGNCGISLAPLEPAETMPAPFPLLGDWRDFRYPTVAAYRQTLEQTPSALNLALLAGHSSLRLASMPDRLHLAADNSALSSMQEMLRLALQQGCIGLSTGLTYPPAAAAPTGEIIELARVLGEFEGALYVTHMRDEGDRIVEAVSETLAIGAGSAAAVVISHLKCAGSDNYGRSVETLELIDRARKSGQEICYDVYPYTASSTSLLPQFVREAESVLVAESTPHPECNGMMLDRIAADWQCSLEDACERLYPAAAIYFQMDETDLQRIMSHPQAMIGSDGIASMKTPHPRLWGTFPRVLGHYVREKSLFQLETAVHKMSGLTAERFGLKERGRIAAGNHADLVLFDPQSIIDRATFEEPRQACDGIVSVWINGELSWHDRAPTGARNGRFLTH